MTTVSVACDLCGGLESRPVYPGTIPHEDLDPSAFFSSSRSRVGNLPIVRCDGCGLIRTDPRDDDKTLARVYSGLEDRAYESEDENRFRTAQDHMSLVKRHAPRPGRLLDVGAATGIFVRAAISAGWDGTGLEASAWAVDRARARCPGARFIHGLVEEVEFQPEAFDAITMWDVLEHVRRPSETLRLLHNWLAPAGSLFLNVPNSESLVARMMGRHWVLLLREHLWYFSPATIAKALRQNGFELTHIQPNFVRFSLANLAVRLSQYPEPIGRIGRTAKGFGGLRRFSLKFPIGEMNVVARKI